MKRATVSKGNVKYQGGLYHHHKLRAHESESVLVEVSCQRDCLDVYDKALTFIGTAQKVVVKPKRKIRQMGLFETC